MCVGPVGIFVVSQKRNQIVVKMMPIVPKRSCSAGRWSVQVRSGVFGPSGVRWHRVMAKTSQAICRRKGVSTNKRERVIKEKLTFV